MVNNYILPLSCVLHTANHSTETVGVSNQRDSLLHTIKPTSHLRYSAGILFKYRLHSTTCHLPAPQANSSNPHDLLTKYNQRHISYLMAFAFRALLEIYKRYKYRFTVVAPSYRILHPFLIRQPLSYRSSYQK